MNNHARLPIAFFCLILSIVILSPMICYEADDDSLEKDIQTSIKTKLKEYKDWWTSNKDKTINL